MLILFIISAGIVYKQLSSGVEYTFDGALNDREIAEDYFVTVYDPSFYLDLEKSGKISLNIETSIGKFYYKPDSLAKNILSIEGVKRIFTKNDSNDSSIDTVSFLSFNPVYETSDISLVNQDITLPYFKFPYMYSPLSISNRIKVIDE